jgi:hypothetical protein
MKSRRFQRKIVQLAAWLLALSAASAYASVNRVIQERYRSSYENKALFLKVPIFSERQYVYISGQTFRHDQAPAATSCVYSASTSEGMRSSSNWAPSPARPRSN